MRFNLTARLAAPLALIGFVVLAVFGGLVTLEQRKDATERWIDALTALQSTVHAVGSRVQSGILTRSEEHVIAAAQAATTLDRVLHEAGAGRPEAASLIQEFQAYFANVVAISSMFLENRIAEGEKRLGEVRVRQDRIEVAIAQARKQVEHTHEELVAMGRGAMAVAVAVIVGMMLFVMLFVRQRIVAPIRSVAGHAAALASGKGDLTSRMPPSELPEVNEISTAFNGLLDQLHRQFVAVREAADSIRAASGEIATGNQDLSHRTEQTASNLQAAASDLTQLTERVRQAAQSAEQADRMARDAATIAENGGAVVAQVVGTMAEINSSSRRIADIVGVIDGIAFQTNILALNAAVEAARAGEQGRGFAVVASEVRALAGRSAAAAKEIKTLIDSSVGRVDLGARQVETAGTTMAEVVQAVHRVSSLIGELSRAVADQTAGVDSVHQSVGQLDHATTQNAALVEQSAAAAESLRDQSEKLTQLVAAFRL